MAVPDQQTGVVIFLDALGTRGVWLRRNIEDTILSFVKITDELRKTKERIMMRARVVHADEIVVKLNAFSDTIIFTVTGADTWSLLEASVILASAAITLGIENGIFFRGAMTYGTFYATDFESASFIIGPTVDEVADWYEFSDWIGVHCTPSLSFLIDSLSVNKVIPETAFLKYRVPNKNFAYEAWVVGWPRLAYAYRQAWIDNSLKDYEIDNLGERSFSEVITIFASMVKNDREWAYKKFSQIPIGKEAYTKFSNTLDFIDGIIKNIDGIRRSTSDELAKLVKAKEEGIISESQFQKMEQQLTELLDKKVSDNKN